MTEIVQNIYDQIGANQTFAMVISHTNRKWLSANSNSLAFRFGRNKSRANYVTITYVAGLDLYRVEFFKATFGNWTIPAKDLIQSYEGVYGDDLRGLFERFTGLRTSLTNVYA